MKNIRIFIWKLSIFGDEMFNIFEKACFINDMLVDVCRMLCSRRGDNNKIQSADTLHKILF